MLRCLHHPGLKTGDLMIVAFPHKLWRVFKSPSFGMNIFHKSFDTKRPLQRQKGFTLVELLIVILVLGILAGITMTMLFGYRQRAHIRTLESDLLQAYKTSLVYFVDHPDNQVDLAILTATGYSPSTDVQITILDGGQDTLRITATHPNVIGVYEVDKTGRVFKQ
jgi:prepilin-type N-terminal cleavage/methylation domain-containing protein